MIIKHILILAIVFLFYGCSTPYQPYGALGGYRSTQLGENTYKVIFKGNQHTKTETVYNYLIRRCAEITIDEGYKYFIVYEDSSYVDKTVFKDEPELDEKMQAQRKDNYLLDKQPVLDTNPRRTLSDQKTKINRTYHEGTTNNVSTYVVGVFKIQLAKVRNRGFEEHYLSASQILEKYKTE